MPNKSSIPDGWLPISAIGKPIAGTKFLPFKVPLKDTVCNNLELAKRFSPRMLMEKEPKLQLIIDLTNTERYYDQNEFTSNEVEHCKISCPGRMIPPSYMMQRFFDVVDKFMKSANGEEKYIGVHCTHGINRTGYFICNYMIKKLAFTPKDAIAAFQEARGHVIEREYFIDELKNLTIKNKFSSTKVPNRHTTDIPSRPYRPPYPQHIFFSNNEPPAYMPPRGLYPFGVNPSPGAIAQFPPPAAYAPNNITPDLGPSRYISERYPRCGGQPGRYTPYGGKSGRYFSHGGQSGRYPSSGREVSSKHRANFDPDARQSQLNYYEDDSHVKQSYRNSYQNNKIRKVNNYETDYQSIGSFSGLDIRKNRVAHKAKESVGEDISKEKDTRKEKDTHTEKHSHKGRAKKRKC